MMIIIKNDLANIDWNEASDIYKKASLGTRDPERLKRAFKNSFITVAVFDNTKLIGMGRALCDGEFQAAIFDVVVLPDYQQKGIGRKIMNELCKKLPVKNIILYTVPGRHEFYKKFGFKKMITAMGRLNDFMSNPENGYVAE